MDQSYCFNYYLLLFSHRSTFKAKFWQKRENRKALNSIRIPRGEIPLGCEIFFSKYTRKNERSIYHIQYRCPEKY